MRTVWRVRPSIMFMVSPGRNPPDRCRRGVRLVRPGSPRNVAVHTAWDRSPPVPQGHVPFDALACSRWGFCRGGPNGAASVPKPSGRPGRWFRPLGRACGAGAVWRSVLSGSGLGDLQVLGEGGRSGLWPVVGHGIAGLPGCRTRAVRRAAKISLTRAAFTARASSSA